MVLRMILNFIEFYRVYFSCRMIISFRKEDGDVYVIGCCVCEMFCIDYGLEGLYF